MESFLELTGWGRRMDTVSTHVGRGVMDGEGHPLAWGRSPVPRPPPQLARHLEGKAERAAALSAR